MTDRILVSGVGARVGIDLSDLAGPAQDRVRDVWRDALLPDALDAETTVVPAAVPDEAAMLSALSTEVTLAALAHRRGELWMLHAAGLADERGRTVVLAAPSGTGKTTAARHLAARLHYVSDETVGIDVDGGIREYRKPLSVIPAAGGAKEQIPVSASGTEPPPTPVGALRLGRIAVLDRRPDGAAAVTSLTTAEALEALAPQSSYLCDLRNPLHVVDALLRATGGAVRIGYSDVVALDDVVDALLDGEPSQEPLVERRTPRGAGDAPEPAVPGRPRYFRAPVVDALGLDDGRIAVLARDDSGGGRLTILDGIAPVLWHAADGVGIGSLTRAVVAEEGDPPDGRAAVAVVQEAVDEMLSAGILATGPGWRIDPDVAWTESAEGVVLLALADPRARPLSMEGSAYVVWTVLAEHGALAEDALLRLVAEEYGVGAERIRADVAALLERLRRSRAVQRS